MAKQKSIDEDVNRSLACVHAWADVERCICISTFFLGPGFEIVNETLSKK
jgi:hypothetical protein